jgi:ribose-phosphate pyrophosphokinase
MTKQPFHVNWKVTTGQTCILNLDAAFNPFNKAKNAFFLSYEHIVFPGGEDHVTVHWTTNIVGSPPLVITQRVNSAQDFFKILLVADAAKRSQKFGRMSLFIPYFPGARQDRVCNPGEPLTVKVYADLINSCGFDDVIICSPHSEVTPALLDNVTVIDLDMMFAERISAEIFARSGASTLNVVCPDAGAGKRVMKIAGLIQEIFPNKTINLIRCEKVRDVKDGSLREFFVAADTLDGNPCIIFDDIVAYGGTFLGLADALKSKGAGEIGIFTCHSDCQKGIDNLTGKFDYVYMTNSKLDVVYNDKRNLYVLDINL